MNIESIVSIKAHLLLEMLQWVGYVFESFFLSETPQDHLFYFLVAVKNLF